MLNLKLPRLSGWIVLALLLIGIVLLVAPQQVPVMIYKLALVSLAGLAGYWLDRSLFPYARPDQLMAKAWPPAGSEPPQELETDEGVIQGTLVDFNQGECTAFSAAMLRRALIVAGAMLAIGLGA